MVVLGMRVAFPGTQRTWCCDAFPSIEKIPRVSCPTLVRILSFSLCPLYSLLLQNSKSACTGQEYNFR